MQTAQQSNEKRCSTTGEFCVRSIAVFDRIITVRRWTSGTIKASLCSLECAERWAKSRGYIATGVSEIHGDGKHETIVIVQHPDQVHSSIKIANKQR